MALRLLRLGKVVDDGDGVSVRGLNNNADAAVPNDEVILDEDGVRKRSYRSK